VEEEKGVTTLAKYCLYSDDKVGSTAQVETGLTPLETII